MTKRFSPAVIWMMICAVAVVIAATAKLEAPGAANQVIPVGCFFASERREVFRLSPQGGRLAFLHFDSRGSTLCVGKPENLRSSTVAITTEKENHVVSFLWIDENCLAYTCRSPQGGAYVECARLEEASWGSSVSHQRLADASEAADIIGVVVSPAFYPKIILGIPLPEHPGFRDLYKVDPATGFRELQHKNVDSISVWNVSRDGTTYVGIRSNPDGGSELVVFRDGTSRSLLHCKPGESLNLEGVRPNGSLAYVVTNSGEQNCARLEAINTVTGQRILLAEDPKKEVDLGESVFDRDDEHLLGVRYFRDHGEYSWNSSESEKVFESIKTCIPQGEISLKDCSADGRKWLVGCVSNQGPEAEYLFNADTRKLLRLDTCGDVLPPSQLGNMRSIHYKARDGADISGYLTVPVGTRESNLPLVVFPHGGPNKRTYWGYDPRVQFFANRGYAVFQPNFRGSSGFGKRFQNAGDKQWGRGVMQDDISDGVAWLIGRGIVDRRRVAIVGGSYGGYAALAGLTFTPELYAVGVCLFGASDLPEFLRDIPPSWKPFMGDLTVKIGDPDRLEDAQRLAWQSPINSVDQIKAPLLVYHGANDELIRKTQADRFVATCRRNGKDVEYLVAADEGHGFSDPLNEEAVYIAIERFLATHIGGRRQANVPRDVEDRLDALKLTASLPPSPAGPNR